MKRLIPAAVFAILLTLVLVAPVQAMAAPDSVTLSEIRIFQDILVTEDFLAIVPYNIPFAVQPDEDIDKTFVFSIITPDGLSENGTALAYPRYNGGYGKGIVSFYLESGMVWEAAYIFRVQENPVYYPTPQKWDFTIGESEYSSDTDQREALRAKIIDTASELSTEWIVDLLTSSDSGQTVLSTYGELYYLNAIPGLQTMCPKLFSVQIETPDYTKRSWAYTIADALRTKYAGTFIADLMTGYAGLFNMNENTAMELTSLIIFALFITLAVWKFRATMLSAFVDGYAVLLLLMLHGFISMILVGLMAFLSVVIGGWILLFNRA